MIEFPDSPLTLLSALKQSVVGYILTHPDKKDELIADPRKFIENYLPEFDLSDLPVNISFHVIDEPEDTIILPIPVLSDDEDSPKDLSEEDLESVAGGFGVVGVAGGVTKGVKVGKKAYSGYRIFG